MTNTTNGLAQQPPTNLDNKNINTAASPSQNVVCNWFRKLFKRTRNLFVGNSLVLTRKINNEMPYRPTTIANYFILNFSKYGVMTPMKLLKLVYISYGFYLALTEGKDLLIDEKPQAWQYGPVFPSLYNSMKNFGKTQISSALPVDTEEVIDKETSEMLDVIWDKFGELDGIELMELTHEENTPWKNIYRKGMNRTIPDKETLNYYSNILNGGNNI